VQRDAARGGCAVVDGPLEDKTMDALEVRARRRVRLVRGEGRDLSG
jgi:hypothetical protein